MHPFRTADKPFLRISVLQSTHHIKTGQICTASTFVVDETHPIDISRMCASRVPSTTGMPQQGNVLRCRTTFQLANRTTTHTATHKAEQPVDGHLTNATCLFSTAPNVFCSRAFVVRSWGLRTLPSEQRPRRNAQRCEFRRRGEESAACGFIAAREPQRSYCT